MSQLTVQVQQAIKSIVESDQEFNVSFDDAWQWLEYSSKGNAKRSLISNFEEGADYQLSSIITVAGGTPKEKITITNDCFKQLAMLAGTVKGKEVRRYFINCEKELKAIKQAPQIPQDYDEALEALLIQRREVKRLAAEATQLTLQAAVAEEKVQELYYLKPLSTKRFQQPKAMSLWEM